jgi:2-polyprenyl-3-methyl-5-hydroxy-6-metoxy-1,4-benzoquinol methylase
MHTDLIGKAIYAYHFHGDDTTIDTYIDGEPDAQMPPSLFFRDKRHMNHLEREALKRCKGKVLDIGAAAGCHSLILQQAGLDVTANEISSPACTVMHERGIQNIVQEDILHHQGNYDTVLLLMNGLGIARKKNQLLHFLKHLKSLLRPGGQILTDSTDIQYHHEQLSLTKDYYGEVSFLLEYKGQEETFDWLYADKELIRQTAHACGLKFELLKENRNNAFLVRLSK